MANKVRFDFDEFGGNVDIVIVEGFRYNYDAIR